MATSEADADQTQHDEGPSVIGESALAPKAKRAKGLKTSAGASQAAPRGEQQYENGVILQITLTNFMNHPHLQIDFDPHVNFIVGKNGSGKSAIVASLMAGLGVKASNTGRNTNTVKSLIRNGQSEALIEIHIANGGADDFHAYEFGETVIVETRLPKTGSALYRLRGANGFSRKSTRNEVQELCSHMNIQAGNPCAMLTQEAAKRYLHAGNDSTRFSFFLEAANLHEVKESLRDTQSSIAEMSEKIDKFKLEIVSYEQQAAKAQEEFEGARALKQLEEKLVSLETLCAWAALDDSVASIKTRRDEEQRFMAEAGEAEKNQREQATKIEAKWREYQATNKESQETQHELRKKADQGKQHQAQRAAAKKARHDQERQVRNAKEQYEISVNTVQDHKNMYEEQKKMIEKDARNKVEQFEKKQQKLRAEQARAMEMGDRAQAEVEEANREFESAKRTSDARKASASEFEAPLAEANGQLQLLRKKGFNILEVMHPQMGELVRRVEAQARSFSSPPIGPIGRFVQLKEGLEDDALVIERALGGDRLLGTFVVSTTADEQLLLKIVRSLPVERGQRGGPLANQLQVQRRVLEPRFNLNGAGRLPQGCEHVINLVNVSNDTAFNLLVDGGADSTLIFPSIDAAAKAMQSAPNGATVQGYARGDRRLCKHFRTKGGLVGEEPCPPGPAWPRGLLQSDTGRRQQQLEEDVRSYQGELQTARASLKEAEQAVRRALEVEKMARRKQKDARASAHKCTQELRQLESQQENDGGKEQLRQLQVDIYDAEEASRRAQLSYEKAVEAQEQLLAIKDGSKDSTDRFIKEWNELQGKVNQLMKEEESLLTDHRRLKTKQRNLTATVEDAKKRMHAAQFEADKLERKYQEYVANVQDMWGERVVDPEGRSTAELEHAMKKARKAIEKQQARSHKNKSIDELEFRALSFAKQLIKKQDDLRVVTETYEQTGESFKNRLKFWKKSVKLKGQQATTDFNDRLTRKGHAGKLAFNYDEEKLSLQVSRDNQDSTGATTSDARNLSGGERSFTTLCYELAMWEFCEAPIRVLDEFDVYMDDTYRRIAVNTLLELCDSQPRRQFLFITPQDMHPFLKAREQSGLRLPRIVKMKDVRQQSGAPRMSQDESQA